MGKINRKDFLSFKSTETESGIKEYPYVDPSNKGLPRNLQKTTTGVAAYAGTFGDAEIMHLLRRTMFGSTKADLEFFKGKSVSQAVDYLLTVPTTAPNPPLNHYGLNPNQNDPDVPYGSTWVNAPNNPLLTGPRILSTKFWWAGLLLNQEKNIQEKMTLFWHNHFSTEMITVQDSRFSYKHNAMLRANCLGNFKSLVKMITTDPAMLVYLNGEKNGKNAPDENYGRELQELFTVGKDLPNHYTEQDVKEAARVLTGWRNNRGTGVSFFDSTQHDTGNKTFSSFYGNTVITGRSGLNAGNLELDDLLTMIFAQQEVSKYICRKIYRYFVYYLIDESVETNVISPLATILRNNNYDIKPVLDTLFKSEHFFDPLNRACMIKSPMDHIIGLCRSTQIQFPDSSNIQTQYGHYQLAQQYGIILSQDIGDPPNVAGWPAYYQEPQYTELWINSDSLPKRNTLCDAMVYTGVTRFGYKLIMDCIALATSTSNPSNPNTLVSDLVQLLYPMELTTTSLDFMKTSFLLSGQSSDSYWTTAWNAYIANPTNTANKATVNTKLQAFLKYLFGQAEYQLC